MSGVVAMLALSIVTALGSVVLLTVSLTTGHWMHPFVPMFTAFGATYSALLWIRDYLRWLR